MGKKWRKMMSFDFEKYKYNSCLRRIKIFIWYLCILIVEISVDFARKAMFSSKLVLFYSIND